MPLPKSAQDTTREKREDLLVRGASTLDGVNTILGGPLYSTNRFAGVYSSLVSGIARNSFPVNPNARAAFGGSSEPPAPAETWTITSRVSGYWPGVASSASGSIVFAVPSLDTIYTSVDAGVTWTPTTSPSDIVWRAIACSSNGSNVVAVGDQYVSRSTNAGSTWSPVTMPAAGSWVSVASSADGSTLIVGGDDTQLYVSSNSGSNWSARASVGDWAGVASSADGMKLVAVDNTGGTGTDYIYTSSDRGVTWDPRLQVSANSVASSADGAKLVATVGTSIYRSIDSGSNWVATTAPARFWASITSSADGSILAAVAQSPTPGVNTLYTSTDSGTTWVARSQVGDWVSIASSSNGSNMVAGSQNGLYTIVYG